jgi:hypothetical protein
VLAAARWEAISRRAFVRIVRREAAAAGLALDSDDAADPSMGVVGPSGTKLTVAWTSLCVLSILVISPAAALQLYILQVLP